MKENHGNQQDLVIEEVQLKVKRFLFELSRKYLKFCEEINENFFYLIFLIQNLQILWFVIHPSFKFLGTPLLLNQLHQVLSFFNFEWFARKNPFLVYQFLIIAFLITILNVLTFVGSIILLGKETQLQKIIHKLAAFQILLMNSILIIPIISISTIVLYCDQQSVYHVGRECFSGQHLIYFIIALIMVVVVLIQCLIYWFLFSIKNPFCQSFLGCPNKLWMLGRTLIKILIPLYFSIDSNKKYEAVFMFALVGIMCGYIFFLRMFSLHTYNQKHFYVMYRIQVFVSWFSINNLITFYLSNQKQEGLGLIESIIVGLMISYLMQVLETSAAEKEFMDCLKQIKIKKQNIQKFLYTLIHLVFDPNKHQKNLLLVAIKIINSKSDTCNIRISKLFKGIPIKAQQQTSIYYEFLAIICDSLIEQNPSLITLKVARCHLLYINNKKIQSIHQIVELENDKLSVSDEFMLYLFKKNYNAFADIYEKQLQEKNNLLSLYYNFNTKMANLQQLIQDCVFNNRDYWEEITEDSPSLVKLRDLATSYISLMAKIKVIFTQIMTIFPNNERCIRIYQQFLINVGIDYKQLLRIKQKIESQKSIYNEQGETHQENLIRFKSNDNLVVITVDTMNNSIGVVLNCNKEIKILLGYDKEDIIGSKINKIMPKVFNQIHDNLIHNFLKRNDSSETPSEKIVYALNSSGFLIQSALLIKLIPHQSKGFQLVGFFRQCYHGNATPGFAIISLNRLTMEGVNRQFINIVNQPIDFSVNRKDPILVSSFLPQINLDKTVKGGDVIETYLAFTPTSEYQMVEIDEEKHQQKKVIIKILNVQNFENQELIFIQMHQKFETKKQISSFLSKDLILHSSRNIIQEEKDIEKDNSELNQEMPLQRKMDDFVSKNQKKNQFSFMRTLMITLVFVAIISSTIMIFLSRNFQNNVTSLFYATNQTFAVACSQAIITLLSQKLINTNNTTTAQQFNSNINKLLKETQAMKTNMVELIEYGNKQAYFLEVNQNNFYQFTILSQTNLTSTLTSRQSYTDGIFQFISSAVNLCQFNQSTFAAGFDQSYEYNQYIQTNGRQLLPSLTISTNTKFNQYFTQVIQSQVKLENYLMIGKCIMILATLVSIIITLCNLHALNAKVIFLYNTIMLWDINELKYKCTKFIQNNNLGPRLSRYKLQKLNSKPQGRHSSLLNIFPKKYIADIVDKNNPINLEINDLENQKLLSKAKDSQLDNNPDYVKLKEINKEANKTLVIFIAMGILILVATLGYFLLISPFQSAILQSQSNIESLGKIRKNILFILYFSYENLNSEKNKLIYNSLLATEINTLYQTARKFYDVIGDPNPVLKVIYSKVESLKLLINDTSNTKKYNSPIFKDADNEINLANIKLNNLSFAQLKNQQQSLMNSFGMIYLIRIVLEVGITLLITRILYSCYLLPLKKDVDSSMNMIRMLPTWLIKKNKMIKVAIMQ